MAENNLLRRARVDRGMQLQDVARRTCLSPSIVARIDAGCWEDLPAGIYARSYVRSFAAAVGVDPETALAACEDRLPRASDPIPALVEAGTPDPPAWWLVFTAWAGGTSAWIRRSHVGGARLLPARLCDALLLLGTYGLLVQLTALLVPAPPSMVMRHPAVALLWLFIVGLYFVLLGGIGGRTLGEWAVGTRGRSGRAEGTGPLRAILQRAFLF